MKPVRAESRIGRGHANAIPFFLGRDPFGGREQDLARAGPAIVCGAVLLRRQENQAGAFLVVPVK